MKQKCDIYEKTHHQVKWTDGVSTWVANLLCDESLEMFKANLHDECSILDIKTRYY